MTVQLHIEKQPSVIRQYFRNQNSNGLQISHLSIHLTCPSSGALALVLVKGQQAADALVGAGVVGVTRGVLGRLAMLSGEAQRAGTGGAAGHRHTR